MGISDFLATAASNFRTHYLEMAARNNTEIKSHSRLVDPNTTQSQIAGPEAASGKGDEFIPSGVENKDVAFSRRSRHADHDHSDSSSRINSDAFKTQSDNLAKIEHDDDSENFNQNNLEKLPDGTYSYRRESTLEFKLDLKFELSAITRTVQSLEDGDITAIDSFAAAGFGLQATMQARGRQVVETTYSGESDSTDSNFRLKERSSAGARAARQFAYQDDNFAMKAFSKESANIRRSLDVKVRENHRRAVNSISMRFRTDATFSFAQATRFNVQTNRVAEQTPEAVGQYLDTAGKMASSNASSDLMNGFFDAVDSYLEDSEQALLDNVNAFFDAAAEELGFSEGLIDMARDQVTQSITSFFDRIETSLDLVASQFTSTSSVPDVQQPQELPTPVASIPAPVEFTETELEEEKALLAVA